MKISAIKHDLARPGRYAYPVVLHKEPRGYYVEIPDFDIGTQGSDIPDAIYMARDAIQLMIKDLQKSGKELPLPFSCDTFAMNGLITFVDVKFKK